MESELYRDHISQDETHWWFQGRRAIIRDILAHLSWPTPLRIMDIGSGAGAMIPVLQSLPAHVTAVEGDLACAAAIRTRYTCEVIQGFLQDAVTKGGSYDAVTLFDVLEHIEKDVDALKQIRHLIAPNGRLILTVPAFSFLWSSHDVMNRHFRRYTEPSLTRALSAAGYEIECMTYFNFFLFPFIAFIRFLFSFSGRTRSDFAVQLPPWVSWTLEHVFAAERFFLRGINFPFGVSLIAIAKPYDQEPSDSSRVD